MTCIITYHHSTAINSFTYLQTPAVINSGLQRYPRYEDTVSASTPIALSDVQTQGLARPLHYFHQLDYVAVVLKNNIDK